MRGDVIVRPVAPSDRSAWLSMRVALWPDEDSPDGHAREIERFFDGGLSMPLAVLVAEIDDTPVGFVELSIRNYAEDCVTGNVAYLEGWYVVPEHRRRGVGRALIAASEDWGRAQGCTEFASDAVAENADSARAHAALGFTETVMIRCFKKPL